MFEVYQYNPVVRSYLGGSWIDYLGPEFGKQYLPEIFKKVKKNRKSLCPPPNKIFRAFRETPFDKVKVVIVGQDPYHTPDVADGLAFSSRKEGYYPPSLKNIFKEINTEYEAEHEFPNSLEQWAEQGVLLLNTSLTTEKEEAGAHGDWGWQYFTHKALRVISGQKQEVVFMLWGKEAQKVKEHIVCVKKNNHLILESWHPSPLSCKGFFGNGHFKKCNKFLEEQDKEPVNWFVED